MSRPEQQWLKGEPRSAGTWAQFGQDLYARKTAEGGTTLEIEGVTQRRDAYTILNPEQTRALFRYLGGLVLPAVERCIESPFIVFRCGLATVRYVWVDGEFRLYGSTGATHPLEFAACFLAATAADEAEGVQG